MLLEDILEKIGRPEKFCPGSKAAAEPSFTLLRIILLLLFDIVPSPPESGYWLRKLAREVTLSLQLRATVLFSSQCRCGDD